MREDTSHHPGEPTTDATASRGEPTSADSAHDTRIEIELELDNYVLEWFRAQGENYEDLMNQVLHDYIASQEAANQVEPEPDAM